MSSGQASVEGRYREAEELIGDMLARSASGETQPIEPLIARRPDLERELREVWSHCGLVDQAFDADAAREAAHRARVDALLNSVASGASFSEHYTIESEIGRGGMGAILRVVDRKLDRPLAMKVIVDQADAAHSGKTPSVEARQLARFLNEAKITGQLDHPGIVPVHEMGVDAGGRAFFTMKLVKGITLSGVFERRKSGDAQWSTQRVLGVIERVCEALAFAHQRGVIHRDLKPANVMVGDFGEVYVMDWGLARRLEDAAVEQQSDDAPDTRASVDEQLGEHATLTRDGTIVGTPAYMSPEQARGAIAAMGPPSDVYSVGAMLYHLIAGTPPHVRKGEKISGAEVLMRVISAPPPSVSVRAAPPELVAICEKAIQRDPSERYRDMRALVEDLRAFLEHRVVSAYESGAWAEAKKWVDRNKPLAASLATAVLAIAAGAVAFWVKAKQANDHADEARQAQSLAEQKAADVLSLSTQKDLDDLVARAEKLWPAHPEMIPAYEEWLARARELIDGRPADEARGIKQRPSLTEHKAKLAELRSKAKPLTDGQVKSDRESHPRFAEVEARRAELLWCSRMLGMEPWPSEADKEAELARESLPTDASGLNALAWPLVDPDKLLYGQEVRAVLLARRAMTAATEQERAVIRDTLAWSLFRIGRLDEALDEARASLGEPGGDALKDSAAKLETWVAAWRDDELAKRRERRDALAVEFDELERVVRGRRAYEYDDAEAAWWDRQLSKLVVDLEALRDPTTGLMNDVLAEPFGWGVAKRYQFAKTIAERSVSGAEPARLWREAFAAIKSSPKYGGLELTPQIGLLPIGTNPHSGLWEFAHLQTGDPPVRGADGTLVLTEAMSIVLVLIPARKFWMGAQTMDPNGRNYDSSANHNESPVHEVELSPYFLSKYEMTQGQWSRIAATNPSYYHPPGGLAPSMLHPVEQVSWPMSLELLERIGLSLPSEAQWECGARGGSTTPWWTGAERESLRGKVNLADQTAKKAGAQWPAIDNWPDLEDGSVVHCAVGKYAANPYGLHEVHGNVWEWCLDGYDASFYGRGTGRDPVSPWDGSASRVNRGGSVDVSAAYARSAYRGNLTPGNRDAPLGLRPSRRITP